MQRGKSARFTIRLDSRLLHELLQRIAQRAYEQGYRDADNEKSADLDKVKIDPSLLRKFL